MSIVLFRYIMTAALRDRVFLSFLVLLAIGTSLAVFFATSPVIEQDQFAIAFMAGGLRLLAVAGLVLFIVFYVRRSFDLRDVEFLLARPISRRVFLFSHVAAFSTLAMMIGVIIFLLIFVWARNSADLSGFYLWSAGMVFELVIVANVALFFSMILSSPVTCGFACLGFYVLARLVGQLLLITKIGTGIKGFVFLQTIMQGVSFFIPRFDLMVQTSWLINGTGDSAVGYGFLVLQAGVFLAMIWAASLIDFTRRQF